MIPDSTPQIAEHLETIISGVERARTTNAPIVLSSSIIRKLRLYAEITEQTVEEVVNTELETTLNQLLSRSGLAEELLEERDYLPQLAFRRRNWGQLLLGLALMYPEDINLGLD